MSKRRHKDRNKEDVCNCPACRNKKCLNNGNTFGLNPSQLISLLGGNVDLGRIGNILSSMNSDGFDLNKLNLGAVQNNFNGGNVPNKKENNRSEVDIVDDNVEESFDYSHDVDENIIMLRNIRNIVDSERALFLDRVIEAYINGDIK